MLIGFVGLGHLGLVSSITAAHKGYQVIAYDEDITLCNNLRNSTIPFYEPELKELLWEHNPRSITFTSNPSDLSKCNLIFVSGDYESNDQIMNLIEDTYSYIPLIITSQVPPGFTRSINDSSVFTKNNIFYQAEVLIIGESIQRSLHPEQLIIGCKNPEDELPEDYQEFLDSFGCPIHKMKYESAEMAKIAINNLLASSVSMTNKLAERCEEVGADWNDIIPVLENDRRIGPYSYIHPSLGLSGGHLERDVNRITKKERSGINWISDILVEEKISWETPITILGLSYKSNTSSVVNSSGMKMLDRLIGFSNIKVYDPHVVTEYSRESWSEACFEAHILMILTEFWNIDEEDLNRLMDGNLIIDPYRVLDRDKCQRLGFKYHTLGIF